MHDPSEDPYQVLQVQPTASGEEVRQAYLKLVREFPPDRDPDRFRVIHQAYTRLSDPLVQAEALMKLSHDPLDLRAVVASAATKRPRLPKLVLLALGNKD